MKAREEGASRHRVVVHGQVHGVGFRVSCARRATDEHLAGWIRNLPDGTVEAVFEGDRDAVDRLTAWCSDGPLTARVTRVEVFDEPLVGEKSFSVR